ncbi:DUF2281 domain-containing protein [Larkinella humicola]|uniref:DUF2281 domain-containing protein n=1 Tax=Larkinella humicola TaxID=2607654 RepID=A0A5N1J6U6_9BACT|nr:DUF2281 domain-containing protein [Larkinella humicola]KAA9346737.1 DUF2281 domain-containing protein [Larkinella humicola]
MELTAQVGFEELLQAVKKLSPEEKQSLQAVLSTETAAEKPEPAKERKFGTMKGLVTYMADDFDAPLDDFKDYM